MSGMQHRDSRTRAPPARLSCEFCQRRKIRCDKRVPCGTCERAGRQCEVVERPRLARGRNCGKNKSDTSSRAVRASTPEGLVSVLAVDAPFNPQSTSPVLQTRRASRDEISDNTGTSFWSTLRTQVSGLHDVLDAPKDTGEDEPVGAVDHLDDNPRYMVTNLRNVKAALPKAKLYPEVDVCEFLMLKYFENVDPVFKVLHRPTVNWFLRKRQTSSNTVERATGDMLAFSIFYAAATSLDDETVLQMCREDKTSLLGRLRIAWEISLVDANFIDSTDYVLAQAYAIFIAAGRVNDRSRWAWTMLSMCVRLAYGMALNREPPTSVGPFRAEMRRRLWYQIVVLDIQAALDRGSTPIISEDSYNTRRPSNINDEDMSKRSHDSLHDRVGFTEMSYSLLIIDSLLLTQKLNYLPVGIERPLLPVEYDWNMRQDLVFKFRRFFDEKYVRFCSDERPFQWFFKSCVETMSTGILLRAIRPVQSHHSIKPPTVNGSSVIKVCVRCFKVVQDLYNAPFVRQWTWFLFVQWHALAVCLSQICSQTPQGLTRQDWEIIENTFRRYEESIADGKTGKLWQPIKRLMEKARVIVDETMIRSAQSEIPDSDSLEIKLHVDRLPEPILQNPTPVSEASQHQAFENFANGVPLNLIGTETSHASPVSDPLSMREILAERQWMGIAADPAYIDWEELMRDLDDTDNLIIANDAPDHELDMGWL